MWWKLCSNSYSNDLDLEIEKSPFIIKSWSIICLNAKSGYCTLKTVQKAKISIILLKRRKKINELWWPWTLRYGHQKYHYLIFVRKWIWYDNRSPRSSRSNVERTYGYHSKFGNDLVKNDPPPPITKKSGQRVIIYGIGGKVNRKIGASWNFWLPQGGGVWKKSWCFAGRGVMTFFC